MHTYLEWALFVGSFLDPIGAVIKAILAAVARFFESLFQSELRVHDNIANIVDKFQKLKEQIPREIQELKDFDFDPSWKTRVIWVPDALDHIFEVVQFLVDGDLGLKARFSKIIEPFHELKLIFSAEQSDAGDPQGAVKGITKTAVKIDEISTCIAQVSKAVDEISDIADLFEKLIEQLQSLDKIFLPQNKDRVKSTVTYAKRGGEGSTGDDSGDI